VECALLEGGAVDGEKSRTPPPPLPPPQPQLAASALHTLALNLSTYILGIGRKNCSIDDLEVHLRTRGACDNRFASYASQATRNDSAARDNYGLS
jgi:hypothetical protein